MLMDTGRLREALVVFENVMEDMVFQVPNLSHINVECFLNVPGSCFLAVALKSTKECSCFSLSKFFIL